MMLDIYSCWKNVACERLNHHNQSTSTETEKKVVQLFSSGTAPGQHASSAQRTKRSATSLPHSEPWAQPIPTPPQPQVFSLEMQPNIFSIPPFQLQAINPFSFQVTAPPWQPPRSFRGSQQWAPRQFDNKDRFSGSRSSR